MAEICKVCGAEIPDEAAFCPSCGSGIAPNVTETESFTATEIVEEAPEVVQEPEAVTDMEIAPETVVSQEFQAVPAGGEKKKAVKWWMIVVPVVAVILAAVLVVTLMWDAIYIRIAPHVVLTEAITNTVTDLATRGEGTIWESIGNAVDEDGKYTAQMDIGLDYSSYITANISLAEQNDQQNSQSYLTLDGNMDLMGYVNYDFNMALYADSEGLALNWAQATGDNYYGIVYDTFGDDIRSNELLSSGIDEETLTVIEEFLDNYCDQMYEIAATMDGMEFSEEYGSIIMEFLKAHKAEIGSATVNINDLGKECDTITYTVTDAEMNALAKDLLAVLENDETMKHLLGPSLALLEEENQDADAAWESFIEDCYTALEEEEESEGVSAFCFYLYNERLVYFDYSYLGEEEVTLALGFGENAGEDDIIVLFTILTEDSDGAMEIIISSDVEEDSVSEKLVFSISDYDIDFNCDISYSWDKDSGDFTVDFSGEMDGETAEFALDMKLYEEEDGIVLEFPELFGLIAKLAPESASSFEGMTCNITYVIHQGADIVKPEYINIREISEEDVAEMEDNITNNYGS